VGGGLLRVAKTIVYLADRGGNWGLLLDDGLVFVGRDCGLAIFVL